MLTCEGGGVWCRWLLGHAHRLASWLSVVGEHFLAPCALQESRRIWLLMHSSEGGRAGFACNLVEEAGFSCSPLKEAVLLHLD